MSRPGKPAPPALVEEPLDFVRPSGVTLRGVLLRRADAPSAAEAGVEGSRTPAPAIVMLHGLLSHRDHNFAPELAKALVGATGHAVYRFDFRFGGASSGSEEAASAASAEPGFRYRFPGFADDLSDLEVVLDGLVAGGYYPWCLIGHSRGANDTLLYAGGVRAAGGAGAAAPAWYESSPPVTEEAATTLRPRAFVALAARRHMPAMLERLTTPEQREALAAGGVCDWSTKRGELSITAADAAVVGHELGVTPSLDAAPSPTAVWSPNMAAAAASIPCGTPFLLLHGTEDEVIPVDDARGFGEIDNPSVIDLRIVEGARHAFLGKKPLRVVLGTVPAWVAEAAGRCGVAVAPAGEA